MTGFTGVVWEARPAQRLAADLVEGGAGATPSAQAALAWGCVAGVLADGGLDYAAILTRLGTGWESATSDHAFARLADFATWFTEVSAAAVENAGKATAQCAATTVAHANMPNLPEIAVTKGIRDTAATMGAALGAPIGGVAADAERALHDQKQRAARVMDTYEAASAPLAEPWLPPRLTEAVSSAALAGEQMSRPPAHVAPVSAPTSTTSPGPLLLGGFAPAPQAPREKTRFATTVLAGTATPSAAAEAAGQPTPQRSTTAMTPAPPVSPLATVGQEPARAARSPQGAGIDAATVTQDPAGRFGDGSGPTAEVIDARYRTGALDLPPATSVPAVLGAPDTGR